MTAKNIGEEITQAATSARGIVIDNEESDCLSIHELRFERSSLFIPTINSTTLIVGSLAGSQANVLTVYNNDQANYLAYNANISANVASQPGSITDLQVIDSGFGFVNGEFVTIQEVDGTANTQVLAVLEHQIAQWKPLNDEERESSVTVNTEKPLQLKCLLDDIKTLTD